LHNLDKKAKLKLLIPVIQIEVTKSATINYFGTLQNHKL